MDRDYSRSPRGIGSGMGADNVDIMRLVVQREQARQQKDWALADNFRERLAALGVTLFDKNSSWKAADGRSGRIPSFTEVENGGGNADVVMQAMEDKANNIPAPPVYSSDSEEGQIKNLIQQREQARGSKDFTRSDQIRDELKGMGVDIYDKDKIWKSKSGLCGVVLGYRTGNSPCPTDVEISTLVQQREKARQTSDWTMGDMIRDELKQWGVSIYDKDKVWKCSDGRSGPVPAWTNDGTSGPQPHGAHGAMVPMVQSNVQMHAQTHNLNQLIAACVANAQNPATSARTMALLQQAAQPAYGAAPVMAYGGAPAPHARAQPHKPPPSGPSRTKSEFGAPGSELNEAMKFCRECQVSQRRVQDHEVLWLVEVREKLRRDKDFAGADSLRQTFRSNIGLELYEKEKSWVMSDGRRGEIPAWTTLG